MKTVFNWLGNLFSNVCGKDKSVGTRLNVLSFILLICFDIFLVFQIVAGMHNQGNMAARPDVRIPYTCFDSYVSLSRDDLSEEAKFLTLKANFNGFDNTINPPIIQPYQLPACNKLSTAFYELQSENKNALEKLSNVTQQITNKQAEISDFEGEHEQFLKERTAGVTDSSLMISNMPKDIRDEYQALQAQMNLYKVEEKTLIHDIFASEKAKQLISLIKTESNYVSQEKSHLEFWYPVVLAGYQALLIFPLLLISLWLYFMALKKDKLILKAISAHTASIVGLFAFFLLLKFLCWIFPLGPLIRVYAYLESHGFLVVLNYVFIALGIVLFIALMFGSQKLLDLRRQMRERESERRCQQQAQEEAEKLKQKQRKENTYQNSKLQKDRVLRNKCPICETPIKTDQNFCLNCGEQLIKTCSSCGHEFPNVFSYCDKCGNK